MPWKVSPSMVVALIAVSIALTGSATAAKRWITGADIKNESITGADIKNGSITMADLAPATRRALSKVGPRGSRGSVGPSGPQGPAGPQGTQGPSGSIDLSKLSIVEGETVRIPVGATAGADAECPEGQRATGGGYEGYGEVVSSLIPRSATRWRVVVHNDHSLPTTITPYVVCLAP